MATVKINNDDEITVNFGKVSEYIDEIVSEYKNINKIYENIKTQIETLKQYIKGSYNNTDYTEIINNLINHIDRRIYYNKRQSDKINSDIKRDVQIMANSLTEGNSKLKEKLNDFLGIENKEKPSSSTATLKSVTKPDNPVDTPVSKNESLAQYALQFVGGKYVWGGSNLNTGVDCSGFVQQVYKNFNINLPHSSSALRSVGTAVNGLASATVGDIICYDGHVAIYLGNGKIVHASNPKDGIKISDNANYRKILSIIRLL